MHVIPSIQVTTPIFEEDNCSLPSIIVTRDLEDSMDRNDDISNGYSHQEPRVEYVSIFPETIFDYAR